MHAKFQFYSLDPENVLTPFGIKHILNDFLGFRLVQA